MQRQAERCYTVEDYFAIEESSAVKHEYFGGEIFAMAGASLRHNRIAGNVYAALRTRLQNSSCEVFSSDLRLRTPGGLYTYPDVMVICGGVQLSAADRLDTVVNPAVIIEVLSESTKKYGRGEKFTLYGELPSLRDYVLIEQGEMLVEHHSVPGTENQGRDEWVKQQYTSIHESVELATLSITLPLSEIYARVDFGRLE